MDVSVYMKFAESLLNVAEKLNSKEVPKQLIGGSSSNSNNVEIVKFDSGIEILTVRLENQQKQKTEIETLIQEMEKELIEGVKLLKERISNKERTNVASKMQKSRNIT